MRLVPLGQLLGPQQFGSVVGAEDELLVVVELVVEHVAAGPVAAAAVVAVGELVVAVLVEDAVVEDDAERAPVDAK